MFCVLDVNECFWNNLCNKGEKCLDNSGSFDCKVGDLLEEELFENSCLSSPCFNSGICQKTKTTFECLCSNGYFGKRCEYNGESSCEKQSCLSGGTCSLDDAGDIRCNCANGWLGDFCQVFIRPVPTCEINNCSSSGTCRYNIFGSNYTCLCPTLPQNFLIELNCEMQDACNFDSCLFNAKCTVFDNEYQCLCLSEFYEKGCGSGTTMLLSNTDPHTTAKTGKIFRICIYFICLVYFISSFCMHLFS